MLRRLSVLTLALTVMMFGPTATAAAADAAPLPEWRLAAQEVDSDGGFMRVYINDIDTLWSEFSRSQLFRALAQDPAVAASTTKMIAEVDKRKKTVGKAIGQDDPDWLLGQVGKLGPFAVGMAMANGGGMPQSKLVIRHRCDEAFVKLALNALANGRDLHLERLQTDTFEMPTAPYAYRVNGGETILALDAGGPNLYSNGKRFLMASQKSNEQALLKQAAAVGVPTARDEAFAAFLGKGRHWLSASEVNYPALFASMADDTGLRKEDLKAILGSPTVLYQKETVNQSNRFDFEMQYSGAELNKGILFFGAGQPLNNEVAQIFPEELVLTLHANYDMKKFLALKPADLPDTSGGFQQGIAEMQASIRKLVTPVVAEGTPAIAGPTLTSGMSLLMLEPDRLEEFFNSFVFAFGIEPGFKLSEDWLKAIPMAKNWDDTAKPVKVVTYSDTEIGVIGEGRSITCLTVVNGVLVAGSNLKQVKRVVRYLNAVKKGEAEPRKSNEWQHINALVEQDGGGTLHAFGLMKMDYLLKVLVPTGLGAGTMFLPDLPTDVDWNAVAGRLQPATGVVLYDPQKGMKGRMVSDLPLGTLASILSLAQTSVMTSDFGFFNWQEPDPEDLPPVGRRAAGVDGLDGPAVEPPIVDEVMPVEEPVLVEEVMPEEAAPVVEPQPAPAP